MIQFANVELPTLSDDGNGMPKEDIQINVLDPMSSRYKTLLFSELIEDEKATLVAYYNLMRNKLEEGAIVVQIGLADKVLSLKNSYTRDESGTKQALPSGTEMPLVFEVPKVDFENKPEVLQFVAKTGEEISDADRTQLQKVGLNIIKGSTWDEMVWQEVLAAPVRLTVNLPEALGVKSIIIN
ncbi:MAG: hypothetical protein JXR60_05980 [Bacteroidales bacterium]|nr:hypothetical protein [Bacteroidales bacterium]